MPEIRTINGRAIHRHQVRCPVTRAWVPIWLEYRDRLVRGNLEREVCWQAGGSCHEAFRRVRDSADYRFVPFDPREPPPIHDELDQARAAGFDTLVFEFLSRNKIKARPEFQGRFRLGSVLIDKTIPSLSPDAARKWLHQHSSPEPIDLSDDEAWCPPLFSQAVQNEAAIRAGVGLIQSRYEHDSIAYDALGAEFRADGLDGISRQRKVYSVHVPTLLSDGQTQTLIYSGGIARTYHELIEPRAVPQLSRFAFVP